MSEVIIVVAYNSNRVIGNGETLPWHIPEDLKLFKETTMGHPCIMGRTTWDGLPQKFKPLPGRHNIIITTRPSEISWAINRDVSVFSDIEGAIGYAKNLDNQVFITGGAAIYSYCLNRNLVDRILASELKNHEDVEGTVFFPDINELGWHGTLKKEFQEFRLVEYTK